MTSSNWKEKNKKKQQSLQPEIFLMYWSSLCLSIYLVSEQMNIILLVNFSFDFDNEDCC